MFAFVRSPEQSGSSYQPASRQNFQWNWHKHLCSGRSWEHLLVPSIHTAKICPRSKDKSKKATILASKVIFVAHFYFTANDEFEWIFPALFSFLHYKARHFLLVARLLSCQIFEESAGTRRSVSHSIIFCKAFKK